LFEANRHNDVQKLDEVSNLLRSIKDGWDGIREEAVSQQQAV
jgi:flagellar protein FliS